MSEPKLMFEVAVDNRTAAIEVNVDPGPRVEAVTGASDLAVDVSEPTVQVATWTEEIPFNAVPVKGDKGDKGDPGYVEGAFEGTAWWTGQGEPGTVMGSKPGDYYIDTLTGIIYKLGD
jgi:hypothetical protein